MSVQVVPVTAPVVLQPPAPVPVVPQQVIFGADTQNAQIAALLARVAALEASVPHVGLVWTQVSPGATWTIPHTLARIPSVQLVVGGEVVVSDIYPTVSEVVVVFPSPTAGVAVLT